MSFPASCKYGRVYRQAELLDHNPLFPNVWCNDRPARCRDSYDASCFNWGTPDLEGGGGGGSLG